MNVLTVVLITAVLGISALIADGVAAANKKAAAKESAKGAEITPSEIVYQCPHCRSFIHGWRPNCPLCNCSLAGVQPYEDKRRSLSDKNAETPPLSEGAPAPQTRPCPECGYLLPVASVICPICGHRFPDAEMPSGTDSNKNTEPPN